MGSESRSSAAPRAISWSMLPAMSGSSRLMQRGQVGDEIVEVLVAEVHRRHERAGLHDAGIVHPDAQVIAGVHGDARADRLAGHQMSEVGAETSVGPGAANGMAIDAGGGFENLAPVADRRVEGRRLLLRCDPPVEVGARLDD